MVTRKPDVPFYYPGTHQHELMRVEDSISRANQSNDGVFLLSLYAPKLFGRSTLLKRIWQASEAVRPTSLVEVRNYAGASFNLVGLLTQIQEDLRFWLPESAIADIQPITGAPGDESQLAQVVVELVRAAQQVVLLLIDDYDLMPANARQRLEESVLRPLSSGVKLGVVLTSESEVKFDLPDLHLALQSWDLPGLNETEIALAMPEYERIKRELREASGGVPLLVKALGAILRRLGVTATDFERRWQEVLHVFYTEYVDDLFLSRFNGDGILRDTVLTLALLRRFNPAALRHIFPIVLPDRYAGFTTSDYRQLLATLGSWVYWRQDDGGGYAFNPSLATLFRGYAALEEPQLYATVNQVARDYYAELLERGPREQYVVEMLYCDLALTRGGAKSRQRDVEGRISREAQVYAKKWQQRLKLGTFLTLLRQDEDLRDYVSEAALRTINQIDKARLNLPSQVSFGASASAT